MVESTYASDSPRSRSPMTEPSSPLHDGPGISGYNHSYLYSYSPDNFQQKLKNTDGQNHVSARRYETDIHDRTFARSPLGSEETRHRVRELSRPGSSATMSSPTSLFTIDSILAPRPIGNVTPTSTTTVTSVIQTPETVESASRTTAIHPLQQQLHHLAFTSADFLGKVIFLLKDRKLFFSGRIKECIPKCFLNV